jgi:hypothetical protein
VTEHVILRDPVSDGSAWTQDEVTRDRSWVYDLDDETIAEAEHALAEARAAGVRHHTQVTTASFPVPAGSELFRAVRDQLEHGRGFALVRGVPVAGKSVSDSEILFAGLSNHVGESVVQDPAGTHIDHVTDIGLSYDDIRVRGYMTNAQLTPHCDSADATTLLCLKPAKSGGVNTVSSALAIYNEILEHNPEILTTLYEGMHYNVRGCGPPGPFHDVTSHRVPVFSFHAGRLSCRFNEKGILSSEQIPGAPPITDRERIAITKVAELAGDPRFSIDLTLEPGEWLLMCNYTVFHNRSAYEDHPEPDRKRLLLRRWLNFPNGRDLTWEFGDHFDTGIRQGPYVEDEPGQTLSDAALAASESFARSR